MLRRMRNTYQNGWIEVQSAARNGPVFVYRWRERRPAGGCVKRARTIGPVSEIKTEAAAWRLVEHRKMQINSENAAAQIITFGALVNRYLEEELPELRHSTADSSRSYLKNYVEPRWGSYPILQVRPFAVEEWLKTLALAPRSKSHIHNLMRVLFNCAMRWELIEIRENPMKLVRVRGASKRALAPRVITIAEFHRLLQELEEPFSTMVILDLATGLRCSELLALKWCDIVWEELTLLVRRAVVDGVVSEAKTKYSKAGMPLDPSLAELLLAWRRRSEFTGDEDWVFASPYKGGRMPWHPWGIQLRHLRPAGVLAGIGRIGWHTFRHTFRSLLDETGAPMKVQQELMRHADIRTTMNVYGKAMDESKRRAHSRIVSLVLPSTG